MAKRRRRNLRGIKGSIGEDAGQLPLEPVTWEAAVFPISDVLEDLPAELSGVRVVLVAERESDLLLGAEMIGEGGDVDAMLATAVLSTMRAPTAGDPRRPRWIRVQGEEEAVALRGALPADIEVSPSAHLDVVREAALGMAEFLRESLGEPQPSGLAEAVLESFFDAAATFYEAAPWKHIPDHLPLGFTIDADPPRAVIVLGQGEMVGLGIHDSIGDLVEIQRGDREDADVLLVTYTREAEVPPAIVSERKRHRWRVAGPAAFPLLTRLMEDGSEPDPDANDIRASTLALRAVAKLVASMGRSGRIPNRGEETLTFSEAGGIMRVRMEWPAIPPGRGGRADHEATVAERRRQPAAQPAEGEANSGDEGFAELEQLVGRILKLPHANAQIRRLAWTFLRAPEPRHMATPDDRDSAMSRFMEWAMFSARPHRDGPTLAERAIEASGRKLAPAKVASLRSLASPRHSLFQVAVIHEDEVILLDVLRKDELRLPFRRAGDVFHEGEQLLGYLFPRQDRTWRVGTGLVEVSGEPAAELEVPDPEIAAAAAEADVFGASAEWILALDPNALRRNYDRFRSDMAGAGLRLPPFKRLQQQIEEIGDPFAFLSRYDSLPWWTREELELFAAFAERVGTLGRGGEPAGLLEDEARAGRRGRRSGRSPRSR